MSKKKKSEDEHLPKKSMKELTKRYKNKKKENPNHLEDFEKLLKKSVENKEGS